MSGALAAFVLFAVPAVPLALAGLWTLPRPRAAVLALLPWAALPALVAAVALEPGSQVRLTWVLFGAVLGVDELRRVFLAFTALLWLGAGLHARGYLRGDARAARFALLWLLAMAGNLGLVLALDVATFYTSFALMTFSAYGLVIHDGSGEALRAGRVYLAMAVAGEVLIVSGLVLAAQASLAPLMPMLADLPAAIAASPQRDLVIACLGAGFGIKAGLPLLHMWLPLAHPVAPVPASAVLSGAMIKAGLLGWLATLPLGHAALPQWGALAIGAGLMAALGAAFVGVHQRSAKTVLAYSSIAQMGLMMVGVGAALTLPALAPALVAVVALYALHHGLAKGALFLSVSVAQHPGRRARAALWVAIALPGLSLAGLMTSGAAAKLALKDQLATPDAALPAWWAALPLLLAVAAFGTTVLIARFLWLLRDADRGDRAPREVWLGWALLVAASALAALFVPTGAAALAAAGPKDALALAWPVLAGAAASLVAVRRLRAWPIPPGDVLAALGPLAAAATRIAARLLRTQAPQGGAEEPAERRFGHRDARGRDLEQLWRREAALVFALLLVVALAAMLGLR